MKPVFTSIAKATATVLLLVSASQHTLSAQTRYPSVGIKMNVSGNGLAAAPAFTVRYSFKKFDIDLGANFQINESRFTGYQGNFCWYVTPPMRKARLGFFTGLRYFYGASLRNKVVATERWKQPESNVNFDELKLRCIEGQVGFGLRLQHSLRFSSFYGVAFGGYHTLGDPSTFKGMHRQINQAQLALSFGLSYSFR